MKLLLVGGETADQATLKNIFARGNHQLSIVEGSLAEGSAITTASELLCSGGYDVALVCLNKPSTESVKQFKQLMKKVASQSPMTVRLLATDDSELGSLDNIHQCLSLPLNSNELVSLLEAIIPSSKAITKQAIVKAVSKVKTLPSPPKVFMQLNHLLKDNTTDSDKIAQVVGQDPALVAKVLQFVNSSAMSKGNKVTSISGAITKMGVDTLSCIVMTAEMFSYQPSSSEYSLEAEQKHSLATAKLAASLVKPELKQYTLIAGLLHSLGKLALYEIDPELTKKFFKNRFNSSDNVLLEQKIFSTDHCHVGAYLLHNWSFPYPIIEAIVLYRQSEKLLSKPFGIAHAVYIADTLLKEQELSPTFVERFKLAGILDKLEARAERLKATFC